MPINRRNFLECAGLITACNFSPLAKSDRSSSVALADWLKSADFLELVRKQMQTARIPGLSLAVIDQGNLIHTAGFGFADLAAKRPMTSDTLINIASITKTITCTAVMQLCERAELDVDTSVDEYLPFKVRNPAFLERPITSRQLLTHTSSIADGPEYKSSYVCGDPKVSLIDWLQQYLVAGGQTFDPKLNFHSWAPGGQYAYSNVGYGVLGLLVERISKMPFADYCKEHIFTPLGMLRSRFLLSGMDREMHATPYTYIAEEDTPVELIDPTWSRKAGSKDMHAPHCLYSFVTMSDGLARTSASELSRFVLAYIRRGTFEGRQIVQKHTLDKILRDQRVQREAPSQMIQGLTWYNHGGIWAHGGGDPGVSTYAAFRLSDGRGVVALANVGGARIEITEHLFARSQQ